MLTQAIKDEISEIYRQLKSKAGFRSRRPQAQMIAAVANTLSGEIAAGAIEAPTGTGKSMAYLVAGLPLARAMERKLVIATATVALQEQLVERDIPQFLEATGQKAEVVIAKGRRRYACTRNLHQLTQTGGAQETLGFGDEELATGAWPRQPRPGEADKVTRLLGAAMDGAWDGDLDAAPEPIDAELRDLITTSAGGCSNRQCAWRAKCPFMVARARVKEADIVVTNQDLLLADLVLASGKEDDPSTGGVLLPAPAQSYYILDEAHHLHAKAIDRSALSVHVPSTLRWLRKLVALTRTAYALTRKERLGGWVHRDGEALLEDVRTRIDAWTRLLSLDWTPPPDEEESVWRAPLGQVPEAWRTHAGELVPHCQALQRWIIAVRRNVMECDTAQSGIQERLTSELGLAVERMQEQVDTWGAWSTVDSTSARPPQARWATLRDGRQLVCHASAVDVAMFLRRVLWEQAAGVVLTSATLAGGDGFRRLRANIGLPEGAQTMSLESPFDLASAGRIEVPRLGALPAERDAHVAAVVAWLDEGLDWSSGNLVLFTSRYKRDAAFEQLPPHRRDQVLVQGALPLADLLVEHERRIEAGTGSTIFGTAGLGEGVDLKGRLCETVVITQIPFAVPTEPVGATYAEWLEAQKRNPFMEVSVPEATRVLIQYCGRLIRTETDSGRVVILDRRLVTKRYGSHMLAALPPFERRVAR